MAINWPDKDPDEVLDYVLDWSVRLPDGDTIASSTWILSGTGLVKGSESRTATSTTVWLSEGTKNGRYVVTNRVTTAEGRTMDQSVNLKVREK